MKTDFIVLYNEACNYLTKYNFFELDVYAQCANILYSDYLKNGGSKKIQNFPIAVYTEACEMFTQFLYTENEAYLQCANLLYMEYVNRGGTKPLISYLAHKGVSNG